MTTAFCFRYLIKGVRTHLSLHPVSFFSLLRKRTDMLEAHYLYLISLLPLDVDDDD